METTFNKVDDPRSARNQKHPFHSLLGITLLGALAGIDNFSALAEYAQMHFHILSAMFPLPHGVPSRDTFRRLPGVMNPEQFQACFVDFSQTLQKPPFVDITAVVRRFFLYFCFVPLGSAADKWWTNHEKIDGAYAL